MLVSCRPLSFLVLVFAVTASAAVVGAEDASERDPAQAADQQAAQDEIKRSSKAARAKGEITFDDLKFQIAKDAPFEDKMITKDIKELDKKVVKLSGYILPSTLFKETDIERFVLVRDNQECCFGPGAAVYDCVIVEMVPGQTTDYVTRPVTVQGKLEIDTKTYKYPGGKGPQGQSHMAVYRIVGQSVK